MSAPQPARPHRTGPSQSSKSPASLRLTGGGAAESRPAPPASPESIATVEQLLVHFMQLEEQLNQVRNSLTHSHRLATLGTIASIIAHEYNNILTPMVSYAQLALAKPDDHELMKKAVEKSLAGAERAAHISSSLLGFAREADQRHAAPLRKTIDETVACMGREPKKDGIELVIDVPDTQVAISPLNLQQVLLNLLLNAKQAMRGRGGRITVSGSVHGSLVTIRVADNGPGIPIEIKDRLFEPFVTMRRGDAAAGANDAAANAPERRGTGLGLCICLDLVRAAGGKITVDSEPGRGATFTIQLIKAEDLLDEPR